MSKYILTLEKASPMHGGEGAFYIYLRRNKKLNFNYFVQPAFKNNVNFFRNKAVF